MDQPPPSLKDLFDKVGLHTETFSRGKNAELFSSNHPFTDQQRRLVTNWMTRTYEQFTDRVMSQRGKKIKDIDEVAHGRIFLAKQARGLGMVDELGGIDKAISYAAVLCRARERGDQEAVRELESGPPPYTNQRALANQRKWSSIYEGDSTPVVQIARSVFFAPRYSLWDAWSYLSGVIASQNHFLGAAMDGEFMKVDLMAGDAVFALPIFVIQGADDAWTPAELSHAFVATITAPVKEFIPIAGAGHKALVKNASAFLTIMNSRVRPVALAQTADRR